MTTRPIRMTITLCVLVTMFLVTAATSQAAIGTTTVKYGPYTIPAGNGDPNAGKAGMGMIENQLSLNVQRPCPGAACTLTGMKANMVYADGTTANWNTDAMMHHMVLMASGGGRTDAMCPTGFGGVAGSQFTERIFASGNERTPVDFTGSNFGVKLGSTDQLHLVADLMNVKASPQTVYIEVEYKWATGADNTSRTAVRPVWLDADGCGDSEFSVPSGLSDKTLDVTAPISGAMVGTAGHLHDDSLNLQVENINRGTDLCVSQPGFGESPGFIDTSLPIGRKRISSMTSCYGSPLGAPAGWMTQGDTLRLNARYYAGPEHSQELDSVMGIALAYVNPTMTPPSTSGLPSVSITSPAANSTGTSSAVSASFTTSGATSVTCQINRSAPVPCASPVSIASLLGTPSVADGAYTLQIAVTNATGKRSRSVSFAVDTKAPIVSVPDPTEGAVLSGASTSVHVMISDANVFTANCSLDGASATDCTSTDGHGHVELTGLANGSHSFTINATDSLGWSSTFVRTFSVQTGPPSDTQAPVVSISSPQTGSTIASSSTTLNFTATDNVGVTGTTCRLDAGAATVCSAGQAYSGLSNGSHTIAVTAIDAAGNSASASTTFTVNVAPADTTAPVVTITSPTAGQSISGSSVSVVFTATDNVGVTGRTCQLSGPTASAQSACTSPKTYSGLKRGTYTVTVRATDAAGNVGVSTRSFRRR
ncbi:MAG: hypothetical protein HYX29_10830 [Solirubrobacterales bacterium]|nr:hypothetical protein [Solirubrobacterales bacterium]